jgi:hypothetical protein
LNDQPGGHAAEIVVMHAQTMETKTQTEFSTGRTSNAELLVAKAVEEQDLIDRHYITQINQAVASGRDDLIDELVSMREVETARSTPLMSLLRRAARHSTQTR